MGQVEKMAKTMALPQENDPPPLDRWRADEVLEPNRPIWGLAHIASHLGLSVDTVRELSAREDTPIYRPAGRYFAWSAELDAWLRSK